MSQKNNKEKILFFKESVFRVARLIFNSPNKVYHIRLLERQAELSTTAVKDAVELLQDYEIVKIEKTEITTNIQANLESEAYHFYKRIFDLYRLKRYGLVDNLIVQYKPKAIVLFGSFAKGEDIEKSDIDILIITSSEQGKDEYILEFEKEMNRNINLHILSSLEKSSSQFKNAVANGIVLHGYLKLI